MAKTKSAGKKAKSTDMESILSPISLTLLIVPIIVFWLHANGLLLSIPDMVLFPFFSLAFIIGIGVGITVLYYDGKKPMGTKKNLATYLLWIVLPLLAIFVGLPMLLGVAMVAGM